MLHRLDERKHIDFGGIRKVLPFQLPHCDGALILKDEDYTATFPFRPHQARSSSTRVI